MSSPSLVIILVGTRLQAQSKMSCLQLMVAMIYKALKNQNNTMRREAENQLVNFRNQNTALFFGNSAKLIADENQDSFIRVSAGTLISRSAMIKLASNQNAYCWDMLDQTHKEDIKNMLLSTLISSNQEVIRAGAHAISVVSSIEIPRNNWLDLVDNLAENTAHQQIQVRSASIITIGYLCEQLKYVNTSLSPHTCEQFIGAIINGCRQTDNESILKYSLLALRNSLLFLQDLLAQKQIRDEVFNILIRNITNESLIQTVYEAFFNFAQTCYEHLGEYLEIMMQFMVAHLQQREDKTLLALELIDQIGDHYLAQGREINQRVHQATSSARNYLLEMQDRLLPEIMRCLIIETKDDLDFKEMRNSAHKTLGTMVAAGNHVTVDTVIGGVVKIVNSGNVALEQASSLLMSTLCEYPDSAYALKYLNDGFQHAIKLLNSNQQLVMGNILSGLVIIAQTYPLIFLQQPQIRQIIDKMLNIFGAWDSPTIKKSIMQIFRNISEGLAEEPSNCLLAEPNILLTPLVREFQQILNNYNQDNSNLVSSVQIAIMNFIQNLNDVVTLNHLIDFCINKYDELYHSSKSDIGMIIEHVMYVLGSCALVQSKFLPTEHNVDRVIKVIDMQHRKFGLEREGLLLIGAMATGFQKLFVRRMGKYWPYIFEGLSMTNDPEVFKAALQCVGDCCRSYQDEHLDNYLEIVKKLISLIYGSIDRDLKVKIICVFSDIFISIGKSLQQYVDEIIGICDLCFSAVYNISNNPDNREYVEQLKSSLIQMYSSIVFGLFYGDSSYGHRSTSQIKLLDHFQSITTFIIRTCDRKENPRIQYVRNCLYLINDLVGFYHSFEDRKKMLRQTLESRQIQQIYGLLKNTSYDQDVRALFHEMNRIC